MSVRVRFAPSPTGDLHVGGMRTALFNYLFARANGGTFVLRIEDTDEDRNRPEAVKGILEGMRWLGLGWDEGPYFQGERKPLYREAAARLLASGGAYRCACSVEELEARRRVADAAKRPYRYERTCRGKDVPADRPHVVRAKLPVDGEVVVKDRVLGEVVTRNAELDDFVVARADGTATYNFCVVVDDIDMRVTHVLRGNDHLANTPKQLHLYRLLGAAPPEFAHIPSVHGPDGKKLSKRHGAVGVLAYRDLGFLPEAMLSYLARLGWSHGDQEEFTREELEAKFTLDAVGPSPAIFDVKKLEWVNGRSLRRLTVEELARRARPFLETRGLDPDAPFLRRALVSLQERSATLVAVVEGLAPFYAETPAFDPKARAKFLVPEVAPRLRALADLLEGVQIFEARTLEQAAADWLQRENLELKAVGQAVRVALTGVAVSPPLFDTIEILGRKRAVARLRAAADLAAGAAPAV